MKALLTTFFCTITFCFAHASQDFKKAIYDDLLLLNALTGSKIIDTTVSNLEIDPLTRDSSLNSWLSFQYDDVVKIKEVDSFGGFYLINSCFEYLSFKCPLISNSTEFTFLLFDSGNDGLKRIDGFCYSEIFEVINFIESMKYLATYKQKIHEIKRHLKNDNVKKMKKMLKVSVVEKINELTDVDLEIEPIVVHRIMNSWGAVMTQ